MPSGKKKKRHKTILKVFKCVPAASSLLLTRTTAIYNIHNK